MDDKYRLDFAPLQQQSWNSPRCDLCRHVSAARGNLLNHANRLIDDRLKLAFESALERNFAIDVHLSDANQGKV